MVSFTELPNEILSKIAAVLEFEAYKNFFLVSKQTAEIAKTVEKIQKVKSLRIKYRPKNGGFFEIDGYVALPNGEFLDTPKFQFPVKMHPEDFIDSETEVRIETQLLNLLLHASAPETSQEQKQNKAFLLFYTQYMAPVELLWVTWNFLEYQMSSQPQGTWAIRFAEFIEYWTGMNSNAEWNGCLSSAPYLLDSRGEMYHRDLLYKEMIRINKQYEQLCEEGAERIEIALQMLKEKLSVPREPIYVKKATAQTQKTFLDFSTEEIVRQIALLDYYDISAVLPCEFHANLKRLNSGLGGLPHLHSLIQRFNHIYTRLCQIILEAESKEVRALILEKIKEIAVFAIHRSEMVDYNFAYALLAILSNSSICRLRHSMALLRDLCRQAIIDPFNECEQLFQSYRSFQNLRQHIANQEKSFVPPASIFLSDYVFIVEGAPSITKPVVKRRTLSLLAQTHKALCEPALACKDIATKLLAENHNWDFADWFFATNTENADESKMHQRSLQIEPRNHEMSTLTCGESKNFLILFPVGKVLLAKNQREEELKGILNPFTTSFDQMLAMAKKASAKKLIPFLVANFYHLATRQITEEENEFPDFRLNIVIAIQYRILLILWSMRQRIRKSKSLQELVDQLIDSIPPVSCFYGVCQRYKVGDVMEIRDLHF